MYQQEVAHNAIQLMLLTVKVPNAREGRIKNNLCTVVSTTIITAAFQTGQLFRPLTTPWQLYFCKVISKYSLIWGDISSLGAHQF